MHLQVVKPKSKRPKRPKNGIRNVPPGSMASGPAPPAAAKPQQLRPGCSGRRLVEAKVSAGTAGGELLWWHLKEIAIPIARNSSMFFFFFRSVFFWQHHVLLTTRAGKCVGPKKKHNTGNENPMSRWETSHRCQPWNLLLQKLTFTGNELQKPTCWWGFCSLKLQFLVDLLGSWTLGTLSVQQLSEVLWRNSMNCTSSGSEPERGGSLCELPGVWVEQSQYVSVLVASFCMC